MSSPTPSPVLELGAYTVSDGADAFHNLPRVSGSNEFPITNLGDSSYWTGIGVTAGMPFAGFLVGLFLFWFFLCCRSGCCSCVCGKCKTLSNVACGLCGKAILCPDVSHVEAKGGCCSICKCKQDETKCIHGGLCRSKPPIVARVFLIGIFVALAMVNIGVTTGMETLQLAALDLADVADDIGNIFADLNTYGNEIADSGNTIVNSTQALGTSCNTGGDLGTVIDTAVDLMEPAGTAMETAGEQIDKAVGPIANTMFELSDDIEDFVTGPYYGMASTAMLFGGIYSILGLIGAVACETKAKVGRFASTILAITQCVGVLLLLLLSIVLMVEMGVGMVIGDFCYPGPTETLTTVAEDAMRGNSSEIFTYFLRGEGANPFQKYYDKALENGEDVDDTMSDMANVFTSTSMCCENFNANFDIDDFNQNCVFYNTTSTGSCDPDAVPAVCTLPNSNVGACIPGAGCSPRAYSSIQTSIADTVIDPNGPIAGIFGLISFSTINRPLRKLLETVLCTHTVDGFYTLFNVHFSVLVLTYIAMYFVSLLRAAVVGTQCFYKGRDQPIQPADEEEAAEGEFHKANVEVQKTVEVEMAPATLQASDDA